MGDVYVHQKLLVLQKRKALRCIHGYWGSPIFFHIVIVHSYDLAKVNQVYFFYCCGILEPIYYTLKTVLCLRRISFSKINLLRLSRVLFQKSKN